MDQGTDWGEASISFDQIATELGTTDLALVSEADTRYNLIDRVLRDVLGWAYGQISVEERAFGKDERYVDYVLRSADEVIVVEAKRYGLAFPSPTRRRKLKLSGSVLGVGATGEAIAQARGYSESQALP
jgi:hypothetical protein